MTFSQCCTGSTSPSHSEQLLNHVVDCIAATRPETLYAEFPISPASYQGGYLKFTYGGFANAINRIAWWIYDTIGQGKNFETLAYIGPNDLTYPSLVLGAVKAGYKTLLLSDQNSVDVQLHLLQATNCKILLVPKSHQPVIKPIFAAVGDGLSILEVPTVDELLRPACRAFQYTKTFDEARWDPLIVLHTSGSTGLPKPVIWVQGFASAYAKQLQLNPPAGYQSVDHYYLGKRVFVLFPPFDAVYAANVLVNAICNQTVMIIPAAGTIPRGKSLLRALKRTNIDVAIVVPPVIEEMSRSPDLLKRISSKVGLLAYSGGGVPDECGDVVAKEVPLVNFYGTTEGASIALVRKSGNIVREDWKYVLFHPDSGAQFRHHEEDIYELVIVQNRKLESQHQIFTTFPSVPEYRTKDLYVKHPSKSKLWRHVGRADDAVVLLTGKKFNPVTMEQKIFSCSHDITGVLVAGSQRFQAALLLEMTTKTRMTALQKAEDIARIWPFIEEVNKTYPSHARIAKTHIILINGSRPLPRSPKGTVQRTAALAEYSKELDALYASTNEAPVGGRTKSLITRRGMVALSEYVRKTVLQTTEKYFQDDENFFASGMDSLQTLVVAQALKTTLKISGLGASTIYENPSISALAETLQRIAEEKQNGASRHNEKRVRRGCISALLREYKSLIDDVTPSTSLDLPRENGVATKDGNTSTSGRTVLLTGSTGVLGSYLLHRFLAASDIAHIYCLNEVSEGHKSQKMRNSAGSLTTHFPAGRVTFLTVDYSKPILGLERESYLPLLKRVSHIVHNAWPVNWNVPLSAFRPQLQGVVSLISLAASGIQHPSILFISSTSAVSGLHDLSIPEEIIYDSSVPAATGYSESKYIAERILHYSTRRCSIKTQVARLGNIVGPINGKLELNRNEWLPSIIRSSYYIGAVPESLGANLDVVNWVPVDALARTLLELMDPAELNGTSNSGTIVYNILNPYPVSWEGLVPIISQSLSSGSQKSQAKPISRVPFDVWISQVKNSMKVVDDAQGSGMESLLKVNPALKLVRFYEDAMMWENMDWAVDKAKHASETLRDLEGIKGEWMQKWMKGWIE